MTAWFFMQSGEINGAGSTGWCRNQVVRHDLDPETVFWRDLRLWWRSMPHAERSQSMTEFHVIFAYLLMGIRFLSCLFFLQ